MGGAGELSVLRWLGQPDGALASPLFVQGEAPDFPLLSQLRAFIAEISGKKHLTGRTDLDVAISNECGRLIANVVIAYNSILLSMLLNRRQTAEKEKFLELLKKISPVAWQYIHLLGHYLFRDNRHPIDLEAILVHAGFD